eukprot:Seg14140.1 transcript_id=Seg14140.1/GoldUCD/mRNA.D3Y31 product="MAP kinase kinase kinase win1" protein_id=Seg14140.1/GoldUCD/D3Y31
MSACKSKHSSPSYIEESYFERSRELYFAQEELRQAEQVKYRLYLKDDAVSGLVSREVLEQSEGFVNARARGIAAIATLDRRLLTHKELLKFGVSFIQENELGEGRKIASGERSIIFSSDYKNIPVTVKRLRAPNLLRLSQEFLVMQHLSSHQAVQHAFGIEVDSVVNGLVLSFVDGKSLSVSRFENSIKLAVFLVKFIEGLAHLHKRGVLHNNLRPCHILVKRHENVPVITGFGNACLVSDAYNIPQSRIKEFGEHCLHPKEVREGKKPLSIATDLHCFGQTLSMMKLSDEGRKTNVIHSWISNFCSLCCSMRKQNEDFLLQHAGELIKLIGSVEPALLT